MQKSRPTHLRLLLASVAVRLRSGCWIVCVMFPVFGAGIAFLPHSAMATHNLPFDGSGRSSVIAIEYPPFLGKDLEGYGIVFELLSNYATEHFKVGIKPQFLPPARAAHQMTSGDWCLSTFPADKDDKDVFFVRLLDDRIKIGLYRKRHPDNPHPFRWDNLSELRGSTVAILRTNLHSPYIQDLIRAGIKPVYVNSRNQGLKMLLGDRIDYAQGDNLTLDALPDISASDVEFSDTILFETESGFSYRLSCADRIFKPGHAPHLMENQPSDGLVQNLRDLNARQ